MAYQHQHAVICSLRNTNPPAAHANLGGTCGTLPLVSLAKLFEQGVKKNGIWAGLKEDGFNGMNSSIFYYFLCRKVSTDFLAARFPKDWAYLRDCGSGNTQGGREGCEFHFHVIDGGFKYFLFSPQLETNDPIWRIFYQRGWFNHQLVHHVQWTSLIEVFQTMPKPFIWWWCPSHVWNCNASKRGRCSNRLVEVYLQVAGSQNRNTHIIRQNMAES